MMTKRCYRIRFRNVNGDFNCYRHAYHPIQAKHKALADMEIVTRGKPGFWFKILFVADNETGRFAA
jgi:hypothetical protein